MEKVVNTKKRAWVALTDTIQKILPDITQEQLQPQNSLRMLGANSMDRAEIIISVMETLDLKLPLSYFSEEKNLGELADLLDTQLHIMERNKK
ncbi:acyl carrier protein [Coxiella burnetii]|uniref:Acyl carrier protein n=1 Tax=Coxiella burnetii (strain Dugway 5J108-111) TaxID=434922 RepID=A9KEM4_COXBN|nr:acyl carrier protein [Coxiella burnetii]ABS77927.1 acyl carrier protein [Coxiella burnetii Dugway 5J108-111]OYK79405.1 acyl carrier protein [Coxiella burnetii]OYK81486.1 acyl carrier protein [Coxiella burnetii]